ncbi:hypothetical protein SO802_007458 [Lithocarpus litseifolius]|uniref:Senescence regulator n=1 Tax=Lithocarpus litseifolius TaxID=425828 RepID=A0AAW2DSQ9_9ROSI
MAKGRKLTTSRSERFLGSYGGGYGNGQGSNGTDSSELGEEDVWSMVDNNNNNNNSNNNNSFGDDHNSGSQQGDWSPRANGIFRRRIPRDDRHVGGLSLAFDGNDASSMMANHNNTASTTMAPSSSRVVHQYRGNDGGVSSATRGGGRHMATSAPVNVPDWSKILRVDSVESLHELDEDDEDGDSEMVPPHEYLAREYARSQKMAATSVFEGVGRTLKGRDMRRVRDAVWSQTGFDG